MKKCQMYLNKKGLIIVTLYQLESESYISSHPIIHLPKDSGSFEIAERIQFCLNSSKKLKEKEEDKFWLGKALLKELKQTSFNGLYKSSICYDFTVKDKTFNIKKLSYLGKNQGLAEIDEASSFDYSISNIKDQVDFILQKSKES